MTNNNDNCYLRNSINLLQGLDGFGFPMILDIYTLMLPPDERAKGEIDLYYVDKKTTMSDADFDFQHRCHMGED